MVTYCVYDGVTRDQLQCSAQYMKQLKWLQKESIMEKYFLSPSLSTITKLHEFCRQDRPSLIILHCVKRQQMVQKTLSPYFQHDIIE